MIHLTQSDRLQHKASWHDVGVEEGHRLCEKHAALIAQDYAATKDKLFTECIRAKLGVVPQPELLKGRLEVFKRGKMNWLCLDGEALAVFTDPVSETAGYRYILTWHFKSLVDVKGN